MTSEEKSSLNMSRTTRMRRSGSSWTSVGALPFLASASWPVRSMTSHCAASRRTSASSSSSSMPSAAVRMMTPASSGTMRLRISLRRLRSGSGSLRLIPVAPPPGT